MKKVSKKQGRPKGTTEPRVMLGCTVAPTIIEELDKAADRAGISRSRALEIALYPAFTNAVVKLFKVIGATPAICKKCGRDIWFVTTRHGKQAPYTPAGISHFADCPHAEEFRRKEK